ncbi:hypothetical protein B0T19DRAFT_298891 [Cercophora scortea]|uniref:Uncharacterized protein n=1 Tax=Cercophora scortea TaxID=314031 RepID=A0AAE0I3D0_9PEZI|nr:hypothetical protein B0T19DRAFT_298891 [Cercophora scortea]
MHPSIHPAIHLNQPAKLLLIVITRPSIHPSFLVLILHKPCRPGCPSRALDAFFSIIVSVCLPACLLVYHRLSEPERAGPVTDHTGYILQKKKIALVPSLSLNLFHTPPFIRRLMCDISSMCLLLPPNLEENPARSQLSSQANNLRRSSPSPSIIQGDIHLTVPKCDMCANNATKTTTERLRPLLSLLIR